MLDNKVILNLKNAFRIKQILTIMLADQLLVKARRVDVSWRHMDNLYSISKSLELYHMLYRYFLSFSEMNQIITLPPLQ